LSVFNLKLPLQYFGIVREIKLLSIFYLISKGQNEKAHQNEALQLLAIPCRIWHGGKLTLVF
jgi:hypothetical protein